jgi:hypothetical protein
VSESSVATVKAGVNAGVVGAVVGTLGDSAVREAPDATFRRDCGSSVSGVTVTGAINSLVPCVSDSNCPAICSSCSGVGERRGVAEWRGVAADETVSKE